MNQSVNWTKKNVKVNQLALDCENPRLPENVKSHGDESAIRSHLLDRESILKIAGSIANIGYHNSSVSIAIQSGRDKYTVLDGNRRLAACQVLMNPEIVPNSKTRDKLIELKKSMPTNALDNIPIVIAPNRKAAEKEIWDIHVSKLGKSWQVLQQLRMYRNQIELGDSTVNEAARKYGVTKTRFKKELAKLYFYECILKEVDDKGEEELLKSGFNKIDRICLSENGKRIFKYEVEDSGNIRFADPKDAEDKIKKLAPYIVESGIIPAQANQEELTEIVYTKIDPINFPTKDDDDKSDNGKEVNPKPTPGTRAKSIWITKAEYEAFEGADRVKEMLNELKKNKPVRDKNLNMVAVSLRVVLELAIYDALFRRGTIAKMISDKKAETQKKNRERLAKGQPILESPNNWAPSLKEMLNYMSKEANSIVEDPHDRQFLERFKDKHRVFIDNLDKFIHNVSYRPAASEVEELWDSFCRPIFDIINKINTGNSNDDTDPSST